MASQTPVGLPADGCPNTLHEMLIMSKMFSSIHASSRKCVCLAKDHRDHTCTVFCSIAWVRAISQTKLECPVQVKGASLPKFLRRSVFFTSFVGNGQPPEGRAAAVNLWGAVSDFQTLMGHFKSLQELIQHLFSHWTGK